MLYIDTIRMVSINTVNKVDHVNKIDNGYMIEINQGRVGKRGLGGERVWGSPPSRLLSLVD